MRVPAAKDFWAGLIFIGFGLLFALAARNYSLGSAGRMGPGYFPLALSLVLLALGTIIALRSLFLRSEPIPQLRVWPLLALSAAISLFGIAIEPIGLVASVALVTALAARAGPQFRWLEVTGLAVALVAFSAAVFLYALGLPLTLWPSL
jgi:hypothetical protein